MKNNDFKIYFIYILIIFDLLFVNFIGYKNFPNITNNLINPIIWIIIGIISFIYYKENKQRINSKTNKSQTILIIILIYLILYFIQGLFFGYTKSPYNRSLTGILLNIWSFISIIFYQELSRNILVRNKGKILVLILFVLIDVNLYSFLQINDIQTLIKQLSSVLLPSIASNLLLIYITSTCGFVSALLYKIPLTLTNYLLPIFPDLNWYFISVETTLLPFFVYVSLRNINIRRSNIRREKIKKNNISSTLIIPFLLFIVCFTAGIFKYKPVAILSNSMYPIFKRGDIVVIEKFKKEDINKFKKYDIIEYRLENIKVIHRIIAIEKHRDNILFITKGDNNNVADKEKVKVEQITGIVKFKIPYLGYPSIWLHDFINNEQNLVETGSDL